ncbi:endonuclease MutS2-like protein [Cinnamomum micranthum f. kanehirae]|uniref:Endonuclease MutS2-like protein n=1 Tax=Cinnamomum micranthum f. kanehirae TaxID=337451 RepID=A0A3S3NHJ8_9MAGN|nr:endonuclease MutS2-like protein [Cinnamomum micranthum f. kanehirae]
MSLSLHFPNSTSTPFLKKHSFSLLITSTATTRRTIFPFKTLAYLKPLQSNPYKASPKPSILSDSLRVLEWDKVCDSVASFAGTSLGREATKAQLWAVDRSYDESKNLLAETNAVVELMKYGAGGVDFSCLDVGRVKTAIDDALRALPVDGLEALAVSNLLQFADILQSTLKVAIKEDPDRYNRFMPLTEVIMGFVINQPLVKSVQQVIDEDGTVKDSALYQLMDHLIRNESSETPNMEVSNIDGRWCIKSEANELTTFNGLLLSSGSGVESLVEPISAVPLNDELQQARALVAKAEDEVLSRLTEKMRAHLDDIQNLLHAIIQMDVVTARARYSLAFGGAYPDFSVTDDKGGFIESHLSERINDTSLSYRSQSEWALCLRNAYHPLLLKQHRETLQSARKDVSNFAAEIRRKKLQWENVESEENLDEQLKSLKNRVAQLEEARPVPVDFLISTRTKVLVITGPNTGGKTISLKTVGLAALMAKSGLYILASEPVRIPWFDSIFADIGDEQSLAQSLSTFSGRLKQISAIRAQSTSRSLVLLDEVGAGTNPLEGAALGMSLLEAFAETGSLLTLATTHHGELKTLKYSNSAFENACVEFDEVNLKPTYKILWGLPGRSNAITVAERLGLPHIVAENARRLYGSASAEINGVIIDMERFKQDFQQHMHQAQNYLMLSRELHKKLLASKQKITEHVVTLRYKKLQEISQTAANARSVLHRKLRQFRASGTRPPVSVIADKKADNVACSTEDLKESVGVKADRKTDNGAYSTEELKQSVSEKQTKIPKVGDLVHVFSLRKKATVLKVEPSRGEIIVQANNMKFRLNLTDVEAHR